MKNQYAYRVVFDRRKTATSDKQGTVEIEVSLNRKRIWINTGVRITKSEWNGTKVIRNADCRGMNMKIANAASSVAKRIAELELRDIYDLSMVVQVVQSTPSESFIEWLKDRVSRRRLAKGTRRHHESVVRSLESFGHIQSFSDLTTANLKKWDDYLRERGIMQTTLHGYHKRLKPYIREAMQLGMIEHNPYDNLKIERGRHQEREYLLDDERERIEQLDLSDVPEADKARDMFIFACYTGLSYSDIVGIRKGDIKAVEGRKMLYTQRKKTATPLHITILPKALAILEKYSYNLDVLSNVNCNLMLKMIAKACNIDKHLTMHVGRHTFATWALRRGIPIEVVSKMLGHTDIKTTQIYAKVLQQSVDEGFDKLV